MSNAPLWGVWSEDWLLRDTYPDRPDLAGLNGRILTLDQDGCREAWQVSGGELSEIPPRLCQICRERPVGRGGQMCPECRDRVRNRAFPEEES